MINKEKWINSINHSNRSTNTESGSIVEEKWVNTISNNTISKKNTLNSVKKYSFLGVLFVCGLLFVSVIKNETRNLQREIDQLKASNKIIKFNLGQAILDHEVITSPENISLLAKEYLHLNLKPYKKSQIKNFGEEMEVMSKISMINTNTKENKIDKLPKNVKLKVVKKIEETKTELRKLQQLYNNPKTLPAEVKKQVAEKIEKKQIELRNIYDSPSEYITFQRVGRWGVVQVVKAFFGMPIIPGR